MDLGAGTKAQGRDVGHLCGKGGGAGRGMCALLLEISMKGSWARGEDRVEDD